MQRALLHHHDAHVAHRDVGRRQLLQGRGELALQHLRLAQLPGLIRTWGESDDQYLFYLYSEIFPSLSPAESTSVVLVICHMYSPGIVVRAADLHSAVLGSIPVGM